MKREKNITHLVHIVKAAASAGGHLGVGDPTASRIAEAVYVELERFPQFTPQEPLTLKTEDGLFVKVEPIQGVWVREDNWYYRVVEDPS